MKKLTAIVSALLFPLVIATSVSASIPERVLNPFPIKEEEELRVGDPMPIPYGDTCEITPSKIKGISRKTYYLGKEKIFIEFNADCKENSFLIYDLRNGKVYSDYQDIHTFKEPDRLIDDISPFEEIKKKN